jgi:hypothetical protein
MNFKSFYELIYEKSVMELFLNPENDSKSYNDIINDFKAHGGKIIGNGSFGIVLEHPSWNYVLKIFIEDVAYLRFVRFAIKNPRVSFPKFYDKPRKIIPRYTRPINHETLYIVRMEKLQPIKSMNYYAIESLINKDEEITLERYTLQTKYDALKQLNDDNENNKNKERILACYKTIDAYTEQLNELIKERDVLVDKLKIIYPNITQFISDYKFLNKELRNAGNDDIHEKNVMQRPNGQLIISDPFAHAPHTDNKELNSLMDKRRYDSQQYFMATAKHLKGGQKIPNKFRKKYISK